MLLDPRFLNVPTFARLDEYVGLWAMNPASFAALWEMVAGTDLGKHVAETQAKAPKLRSQMELTPARQGKSIAVVKMAGPLMKQVPSMGDGTSSVQLRRDIRQAADNPDVSGILLVIDSPGGTVAGTEELVKDVRQAARRKPVYAQIEDLGASAAYWIASQCDQVFANGPTALVGSIGTILTVYDASARAEQKGVKCLVFATGPLKGAGTPGAAVSEEQTAYFQGLVDAIQPQFDEAVRKGRSLTDKQLADVRTGGLFTGEDALSHKLIDGLQSYDATLQALIKATRPARSQVTSAGFSPPASSTPARETPTMEFAAWVRSQGFDPENLTPEQSRSLSALYDVERARQQNPPAPAEPEPDAIATRRAALAAETARVNEITRLCAQSGNPTMEVEGQRVDVAAHAIAQGWPITEARRECELQQLRRDRTAGPGAIMRDRDRDCNLQTLQAAMILRSGSHCQTRIGLDHPAFRTSPMSLAMEIPAWLRADINSEQRQRAMEAAWRYREMSMMDICREAIRLDGKECPESRAEIIKASFSGGTLTSIFTTNVNAILLAVYQQSPDTTIGWTRDAEVNDFKVNERPRMTKGPNLVKLGRGGHADHVARSDTGASYKIARYAKQFVVDEQDWIDDRFGAFSDTPYEMGQAASRLRPDLVYSILLANPTIDYTGRALFNSTDGNTAGTSPLSADNLKTQAAAMAVVQENGVNLNLRPSHLIVPWGLAFTARQLLQSSFVVLAGTAGTVTERGDKNVLEGLMAPVEEPRLDNGLTDPASGLAQTTYGGSATTWYLASNMAHTIEVGYLRGTGKSPQVRAFVLDRGQWGMGWDVSLDIGAKALDWRGFRRITAS